MKNQKLNPIDNTEKYLSLILIEIEKTNKLLEKLIKRGVQDGKPSKVTKR